MNYSRQSPSKRYTELLDMYKQLHVEGEKSMGLGPEQTFHGISLIPHIERIKRLVQLTDAETILDYGSGKGIQYELPLVDMGGGKTEMVIDYWDIDSIDCYDPGFGPYSELPEETYDGLISTDMLEHCPEEDVDWVVDEMFAFSQKFIFANVASYLAKAVLPNGENAHCTIKPLDWWGAKFAASANKHQIKTWQLVFTEIVDGQVIEKVIGEEE